MKTVKTVGFISGILIALLIIGSASLGLLGKSEEPKPLKIGLVNMVDVFDKFKKRKEYTDLLEKEKKIEEEEIKKIETKIKELKKEIDLLEPDSELKEEKETEIKILSMRLENRIKNWNRRINRKVNEQTALLYNEIREAIDKYAQLHGFTLVLKTDPARLEKDPEEGATLRINTRAVVYYDKSMDITEEIIKVLNEK